jgi:hypothetical protein
MDRLLESVLKTYSVREGPNAPFDKDAANAWDHSGSGHDGLAFDTGIRPVEERDNKNYNESWATTKEGGLLLTHYTMHDFEFFARHVKEDLKNLRGYHIRNFKQVYTSTSQFFFFSHTTNGESGRFFQYTLPYPVAVSRRIVIYVPPNVKVLLGKNTYTRKKKFLAGREVGTDVILPAGSTFLVEDDSFRMWRSASGNDLFHLCTKLTESLISHKDLIGRSDLGDAITCSQQKIKHDEERMIGNGVVFTVQNKRAASALRYALNSLGSKAGDQDWANETKLPLTGSKPSWQLFVNYEDLRRLECVRLRMLYHIFARI